MKVLSAEQIRKWDEFTIKNEPVSSIDLMERAAQKCTDWLINNDYTGRHFRIFCGKGNNGGDGLAIARQLAERNITAEVYILEFGSPGTPDFQENLRRLHSFRVNIHFIQHSDFFPVINEDDIVIDALFGSGLNRSLDGLSGEIVKSINALENTVISVDLPSGMFADKSSTGGTIVEAYYTLTFQVLKLCFLFPENEQFFGKITVLDIDLHSAYLETVRTIYELADDDLVKKIYKPRENFSHKGTYGHTLLISGEKGKIGASILCTKAALRSGAGLVTSMIPVNEFTILQTAVPEAMAMAQEDFEELDFNKYSSIGVGPGLGTGEKGARILQRILSHYNKPIVVDADGLNIIAANEELLSELPPGSILSPHPKEFERLFGKSDNHPERIQTARYNAQKLFVYIIVKGHNSVLACPDGEVYFNTTGNPGMATGGSGDVLTGILSGLLAQGYSPKETCLLGMFIHGLAADIAVKSLSQEALIAGDIIDHLGASFLSLAS